jgi:hypothetical protein
MPKLKKHWEQVNTVTVAELIAKLQTYPPTMAVAYTWESQIVEVVLDNIEVIQETNQIYGPVLLLDAEGL